MVLETEDIIEEARKLGIANETKIRNIKIFNDYKDLRKCGISYVSAIEKLSKKYFLGFKRIETILTDKKNEKY